MKAKPNQITVATAGVTSGGHNAGVVSPPGTAARTTTLPGPARRATPCSSALPIRLPQPGEGTSSMSFKFRSRMCR